MTATAATLDDGGHILPDDFVHKKVYAGLSALLSHVKAKAEDGLFADMTTRVLMDITAFKIPSAQKHFFNIVLPHSPYPPESDILVIIPDDMKTSRDPEVIVPIVKDSLNRAGIKVREVMTLKQLKDEYSTFEAKRQLAKRIDVILSDIRVFKNLSAILGREFYRKKKFPIALKLDPKLETFVANDFEFALRKTVFNISTCGITSTIVIGETNLTEENLTSNVSKICNWLLRNFPGGWENVAKLSVFTANVPPLIVYLAQGTRNDVNNAIGQSKKLPPPEEGELSTLPGRRVRVHAHGKIDVIKEVLDKNDDEVIRDLGVEKELRPKRSKGEKSVKNKKPKLNLEDKYVDETSKRLDFEDEEAAAAEEGDKKEAKHLKKKKKAKKAKKVRN